MIKRIIAAIGLNLLMILFFSACDNNINGDTNTKSDANPLTNTPTPISINHAANSHTTTESDTSTTTIPSSNETTEVTPTVNISDSDTNKTCLVDKFHNIFFGTIDTEEICMDFYLDGNNITAFYISKASENEVKLVGKLNGFNITLKDLSQNTLTGTISSYDELGKFQGTFSQSNGKELPMDLYKSYACGGSLDNFYEIMGSNNNEVENFVSELKNNLISTNKKAVAQVVKYPIDVYVGKDVTTINSAHEFIDNYDKIMNEIFINTISTAYTKFMFNNYQGVLFGGDFKNIWIQKEEDILIIKGINN